MDPCRALKCERGLLERADGSARWTQDGSSCLAGVYGPRQTQAYKEDAEQSVIQVGYKPRTGLPGARERVYEQILKQIAEGVVLRKLNPRTVISITIQELSEDGGLLSCAINALCIALADAGIPMRCTFAAATCSLTKENQLIVDPSHLEEKEASAVLTVAFVLDNKQPSQICNLKPGFITSHLEGKSSVQNVLKLKELCGICSQTTGHFVRQTMLRAFD